MFDFNTLTLIPADQFIDMRLLAAQFLVLVSAKYGHGFGQSWIEDAKPSFPQEKLDQYGILKYNQFVKKFKDLDVGLGQSLEEQYRTYRRDCYLYSSCNIKKSERLLRMQRHKPRNEIDLNEICPDSISGDPWDPAWDNTEVKIGAGQTIILDHSVNVTSLDIVDGGTLIFKDLGEGSETIKLRSLYIKISKKGALWVGSRACRYQGNADIVLYGNKEDMEEQDTVGTKYLWVSNEGVLEMHGKEKHSWTYLEDHLVRNGIAADNLTWIQDKNSDTLIGNRMIFQMLSAEGDLRELYHIDNQGDVNGLNTWLSDNLEPENVVVFFTDFVYYLSEEFFNVLSPYGINASNGIDTSELFASEINSKYSQIAGIFNTKGQADMKWATPEADGTFHFGLKAFVGPVDLGGEKSGFDFAIQTSHSFQWNWNNKTEPSVDDIQGYIDADTYPNMMFNKGFQRVDYTSSTQDEQPIITLTDDVTSWKVGDEIMVASTSFDARDSEVFTIIECDSCSANQLKLDRAAEYTHWGRISPRTGIDQRAEVGLLSRNVRFYGEMSADKCQYAYTRESLDPNSPNHGVSWCDHMTYLNGGKDVDMHGAHMIFTAGFDNVHLSHIEIFNAGQPRLARYPVHWHHSGHVGASGNYDDPSSVESLSIHDSFSRFVTVHGTHEAIVKNNVGYNCIGHGYFLEDGYEQDNWLIGNLGVNVRAGIILPSERHHSICKSTNDGWPGKENQWELGTRHCEGLSVFWISNLQNHIHDNAAVGGFAGIWAFTHSASDAYGWDAIPIDPDSGKREWRNNKMSACLHGFAMDETVKDQVPTEDMPEPAFSINGIGWKVYMKSMNGPTTAGERDERPNFWAKPNGNWARLELNGWKIHHTINKNWARNADVQVNGWQVSDNLRGYVIKATTPIYGAQKSVINSVFVGMTRNTGHKYCANMNRRSAGRDFITTADCGSKNDKNSPMNLDNVQPGKPVSAGTLVNNWYKPIGDVYRSTIADRYYPVQGMSIYDTWMLQSIKNNRFYDFFSDAAGTDGYRHAVGVHFSNNFHISMKNCFVNNMTFINTARHIQMGVKDCTSIGCDDESYTDMFGDDWGTPAQYQDFSDGEKTMGFLDMDGHFNNGTGAFVLWQGIRMFTTGCRDVDIAEGVGYPGIRVCPLDVPIATFQIKYDDFLENPKAIGFSTEFEPTVDSEGPTVFGGNDPADFMGDLRAVFEAHRTYKMNFLQSAPPGKIDLQLRDADHKNWFRISLCIGTAEIDRVKYDRRGMTNEAKSFSISNVAATETFSFDELHASEEGFAYFREGGWLHLRFAQLEDRFC